MMLTPEQRASASETCFGSLLQLKHDKIDRDFVALLLNNFNPDVCRLKVGQKNTLVSETDVEEIFGIRLTEPDVPMTGESNQLEALAAICDLSSGSPKVAALEMLLTELPPGNEFKRAFILFTIGMLFCPTTKPTTFARH